jgi:hypothetical protein
VIIGDEKLRKVSDGIFQEAEPSADRSRPLEWRRSLNFINLPLKNIKIVTSCSVHETEFRLKEEQASDPLELINPNLSHNISITGILDDERAQDTIYCAVSDNEDEDLYSVEKPSGEVTVSLKAGEPSEKTDKLPGGIYWGNVIRSNFEPGEDDLCFELTIPKDEITSLVEALRADDKAMLNIGAHLLSFTYEVDDALREPYHPQDIIINDTTYCFVSWADVTSLVGQHFKKRDSDIEDDELEVYEEQPTPEQRSHQELLDGLLSYSKPLNRLVTALWVLVIAVALYVFFR